MENEQFLKDLDEALVGVASKKSDTDIYLEDINNALTSGGPGRGKGLSGDTEYFGGLGFGDSRYDDRTMTQSMFESFDGDLNEMRAQRQPWIDKAGAGLARVGVKVAQEIAKMPGMLAGSVAAPFSENPWDTAFNNTWINTIDEFAESINEEVLPVYVKKAVREGNLWDNIKSIDFWATEGADGVGFMASMLVPGLALSKLGAGARIIRGLGRGGEAILGSSEKALDMLTKAGITSNRIDIFNATLANTMFEAGAEAGNAMKAFEEQLEQKRQSGEITEFEYNEQLARKGELGRDIFIANAGILLGPNLIANKILLGKEFGDVLKKSEFYKKGTTEMLQELPQITGRAKVKEVAKRLLKAYANPREGFFEEGLQSTVENYYTNKAETGEEKNLLGDLGSAYIDMISTVDGQKAVFLGQFLGGPMNIYQDYKESKAKQQKFSNLHKAFNENLNGFSTVLTDIYKKNGEDYVLDENGKRIIDPIKVQKVGNSIDQIENVSNILEVAQITGNKELYDGIRSQVIDNYVMPFITEGDMGIEILKDQLNSMQEIAENVAKYNQTYGTNLTKKSFVSDVIRQAERMKEDFERFDTYGKDIIKLDNKEATREDQQNFFNSLTSNYILTKSRKRYMENYLDRLNSEKSKLDNEYAESFSKSKEAQKPENSDLLEQIKKSKPLYQSLLDNISNVEENIVEIQKQEDAFFDQDMVNKEFENIVKTRKSVTKKEDNKESEKADEAITKVKNAKTEEEVDTAAESSREEVSPETQAQVVKEANKKKDEIEEAKQNEASEQINKISNEAKDSTQAPFEGGEIVVINGNKYQIDVLSESHIRTVGLPGESWDAEHSGKIWTIDDITKELGIVASKEVEKTSGLIPVDSTEGGEIIKGINKVDTIESIVSFNNEGQTEPTVTKSMPTPEELNDDDLGREDVKVIGVDYNGRPLSWLDPSFIDYLNNGISKIGDKVTFELGKAFDEKSKKAIDLFNSIDKKISTPSEFMELVEKNPELLSILFDLPIVVKTKEGFTSFLTGKPAPHTSAQAKEIFTQNELPIRQDIIIAALSQGKDFTGISSTIEFQYPGLIKKAPFIDGKVPENNILDLFGFEKPEDVKLLVSSNEQGDLFDENKVIYDKLSIKAGSKRGWVYMEVPMANGKKFPMKLNIAKVGKPEAELLYRLYQEIFASKEQNSIGMTLDRVTKTLQDDLKTNFKQELDLFNKPFNDIRVFELIDLFVYSSKGSTYKFESIDGSLNYGPNKANRSSLPEFRNSIIDWLTTNKRRHIDFAVLSGGTDIDAKKYKAYLLNNKILNTDTVINEPIFQGITNIYINKKIDIKPSRPDSIESQKVDIESRFPEYVKNFKQSIYDIRNIVRRLGGTNATSKADIFDNVEDKFVGKTITGDNIHEAIKGIGVPGSKGFKRSFIADIIQEFNNIGELKKEYDAEIDALEKNKKSENKSEKTLKSQKNIVSLQNIKNTEEKTGKSAQKGFDFMKKAIEAKKSKGTDPETNCK